jgi:hypothetical protein
MAFDERGLREMAFDERGLREMAFDERGLREMAFDERSLIRGGLLIQFSNVFYLMCYISYKH